MIKSIDKIMLEWIDKILVGMGLSPDAADTADRWVILAIIVLLAAAVDLVSRLFLLRIVRKVVARTKVSWDDIIFDDKVMRRLCNIITPIMIYALLPIAFPADDVDSRTLYTILVRLIEIYIVLTVLRFVNSLLRAVFELADHRAEWQGKPIKGLMQTGQVAAVLISTILVVSILIDKSPAILLTGLGASAAVMMLIFKDSILGLVAGVQLSANDMLKVGDWINMPKQGVNGVVEEVALTIVKVRAWDNTVITLPPYLLISESFENWQAMRESGGRRIMRSVNIDMSSVEFCSIETLERLRQNDLLKEHLTDAAVRSPEGTPLTNLDLFMHYLMHYLHRHPRVHQNMTILVRQLQPTEWGLPLQLYFFSNDVSWIPYENLQSEIVAHLIATAQLFGLRIYQAPSGTDLGRLNGLNSPNNLNGLNSPSSMNSPSSTLTTDKS